MTVQAARIRIQIEFIEMPGLKLTSAQVSRLCDLPAEVCDAAIALLVTSGFLRRASDGSLLRCGLAPSAAGVPGHIALLAS